jgi:hypothetical protein
MSFPCSGESTPTSADDAFYSRTETDQLPTERTSPVKNRRIAQYVPLGALVLVLALVPAAFAAKGGGGKPSSGGGTGTISLQLPNSTDGLAHVGQKVTFAVYTTATQYPWVTVNCYDASGAWVYHASNGVFPTSLNQVFTLASNTWMSGDADCTAWLQNWDSYSKRGTITNLASTTFHVYG